MYEIYQSGADMPLLSVSEKSSLECDQDGDKLARVDEVGGLIYEVDVPAGVTKRVLASFDRNQPFQEIAFSPDLKSVASRQPLTPSSSAINLNVILLSGSKDREIRQVKWSRDSSKFFGISQTGKANAEVVQIFDAQGQKIGSGALPPGSLFREGWFANSQTLHLELGSAHDEFGAGTILKCRIEGWKCETIASNVLDASAGGDGILGIVQAVGKYSSDGDTITYPPGYVVEIRNGDGLVVARQTFQTAQRHEFHLTIAPSGTRAILFWYGKAGPGCPAEEQKTHSGQSASIDQIADQFALYGLKQRAAALENLDTELRGEIGSGSHSLRRHAQLMTLRKKMSSVHEALRKAKR
jgi:hypothetical protein